MLQMVLRLANKKMSFTRGQRLFEQGNQADCCYIIQNGEVKITKTIRKEPLSQFYQTLLTELQTAELEKLLGCNVSLGIGTETEIVGNESLFTENPNWEYTVTADSLNVETIAIKLSLARTLPEKMRDQMFEMHNLKSTHRLRFFMQNLRVMLKEDKAFQKSPVSLRQLKLVDFQLGKLNQQKKDALRQAILSKGIYSTLQQCQNSIKQMEEITERKQFLKTHHGLMVIENDLPKAQKDAPPTFVSSPSFKPTNQLVKQLKLRRVELDLFKRKKCQNDFVLLRSLNN